ncbi:hypothetical protein [Pseudoflavonifractor phocaeensis]|uniref:hypothetical protein n=1 Tax=Pseudoflavonifractor phocaeensis TaxID=1870988 RepID=UPI001958E018|nr:hypothetical protein [Pseudoflavonifractor phocaeensis]MBM6725252.1 hypothetical protein [Pseudoflavonifractor phocaeensis]
MIGKPYGYYFVYGEDLVEGMPTTDRVWWFVWNVPSGIWAYRDNSNKVWRAEFTNGFLYRWREVAFCDPPQEYDLPLAEGVTALYKCRYRKDQFGNIVIKIAARITGASKGFVNVATLPEGYRPQFDTAVPASIKSVTTGSYTASSAKIVQGAITVEFPDTGDFEFYANYVL